MQANGEAPVGQCAVRCEGGRSGRHDKNLGLSPLALRRSSTHIDSQKPRFWPAASLCAAAIPRCEIRRAFKRFSKPAGEALTMPVKLRIRPWWQRLRRQFFVYRRLGWGRFRSFRAAWQVTWSGGSL